MNQRVLLHGSEVETVDQNAVLGGAAKEAAVEPRLVHFQEKGIVLVFSQDCQVSPRLFAEQEGVELAQSTFENVAPGETVVSAAEERELVEFVKAGGHLFMTADAGRRVVERESDDWCLLRDFGFEPREWDLPGNIRLGGELPLEERDFGCGRVTVLWASSVVPPGNDASTARVPHFLRSLAAAAGAALPVDCDDRRIAVNLLAKDDGTRYLLVCARDGVAVGDCSAKLLLPDGRYRVEQLLGDTPFEPCDMDSAALGGRGIPCGVRANEVRMWRISAK